MFSKKGVAWKPVIWIGGAILVVILLITLGNSGFIGRWFGDVQINTDTEEIGSAIGPSWNWLTYVFGGIPTWLPEFGVGSASGLIITIAIFFLVWVTFGDIIQNFSTFSPPVAWISSFLIAIIAANLKFSVVILSIAIGVFAPLGGIAVVAGLVAAFVAFFAVNWGAGSIGPWVMRRKAMMYAQRTDIETQEGAEEVASAVQGMKRVGRSLAGKSPSKNKW